MENKFKLSKEVELALFRLYSTAGLSGREEVKARLNEINRTLSEAFCAFSIREMNKRFSQPLRRAKVTITELVSELVSEEKAFLFSYNNKQYLIYRPLFEEMNDTQDPVLREQELERVQENFARACLSVLGQSDSKARKRKSDDDDFSFSNF